MLGVEVVCLWTFRSSSNEATGCWDLILLVEANLSWDTTKPLLSLKSWPRKEAGIAIPSRGIEVSYGQSRAGNVHAN